MSVLKPWRCDVVEAAVVLWRDGNSDVRKLKGLEEQNRKLKKLPAESMLDLSRLKEMLKKTSDALLAETCCEVGHQREQLRAAVSLQSLRAAPENLSLCFGTPRRRRVADQAKAAGFTTTSVPLPASGAAIGSARAPDQSQEPISAPQARTAVRAQARWPQTGTGAQAPMAIPQDQNLRSSLDFAPQRPAPPHPHRGRRLHPGMSGPDRGHLAHRSARDAST